MLNTSQALHSSGNFHKVHIILYLLITNTGFEMIDLETRERGSGSAIWGSFELPYTNACYGTESILEYLDKSYRTKSKYIF